MQEFLTAPADAGVRADVFVAQRYPQFTRSALAALFDQSLVQVNGVATKPSHKVKDGDKIVVDESPLKLESPKIDLPIIYEDENVVVLNKPTGVLTHSKGALNLEGTVASFIGNKINDSQLKGNRAGIVHRLDRGTSGVIITAKNANTQGYLQKQFSTRKVKKTYLAVTTGVIEPPEAIIDVPIGRNPKRPQTFMASASGKSAITRYKVLKTIEKNGHSFSLVELTPLTGRTHQLRVHLAYVGHPIVGDHLYGHDDGPLLLHAQLLEVTLPGGSRRVFKIDIPDYIKEFTDDV
jgi:23S rRNA pseudouridine1911/1915/1917 synthase